MVSLLLVCVMTGGMFRIENPKKGNMKDKLELP